MKRLVTNLGLLQIFFSLLLVIAIMFVSTYYIYRSSISGIYEKVTQNNNLVVKSIVQSFDNSFRTIDSIIHSIHSMPPYDNLLSAGDERLDMVKVYTLVENLSTLISTVDYIEEVAVFYNDADLVITSKGTSNFQLFYNNKYKHPLYNANYWRTFSLTKHAFTMFPADDFQITVEPNRQVLHAKLMIALSGNKVSTSSKNIMVLINVEALMKHVNQQPMIPGASLIMLDQSRNIIYSTDKQLDLVDVLNDVYFNTTQEASLTRENYEYNFYKSDYNDFIYIDKVPYQFQNLNSVAEANYMIMLFAIISAIVLSVFLSIYLNRPVKNILRLLGGGHSKGNDFRKIYSGIVKLQSDNDAYRGQISFIEAELRRGVLLQALDENVHSKEHDIQMQRYYPDFFREKHFVMVLFEVNDVARESASLLPVETIAEYLQSNMKRDNIESIVYHAADSEYIALIGLTQPNERDKLIRRLRSIVASSGKEELAGYSIWVCVSKLYASEIENCKRAYRDVNNGMIYRNVNESDKVLDVEDIQCVWNVYFPFERLEKLSNYLLSGKSTESIQIVKETLKENRDRNVHHHQLMHIARTIFFYMLRYAGGAASSHQELYELEKGFRIRIESTHDYQAVEDALVEVVRRLAAQGKNEPKNKLNPAFISQYIELHYMENLYLDHIAEVTETTPKYFSNYFKKSFGVNYVEYLNKVRLTHAKDLLKNTSLSIAEVGERTGYLNSSTFTTTFKKYIGISPSDYRKQTDSE